ncbi:3-octaprenyl-4-hydroxybenzoate carboxy-lyase [Devosia sp. Root685]|uniref:UbiX family flavin prenyltransferase n=1 Tax=Devosia sp. Root685 TaxID=1736587 RepID=UPI0006FD0C43|nr:UbiX family flavin prenyltransferase [Devosia sp. Root685]KRA99785.1 3-octaprenyl-4-hydroxybenzoate carboxy-lyase [Devosia sp. Root685]
MTKPRIIVGISGASGAIYGKRCLEILRDAGVESHLVISKSGVLTIEQELGCSANEIKALADVVHAPGNIGASCSSGSFKTLGMIVAPCSMRSLAEIATGVTSSLLTRAAEVTLKERRRLVLLARETPLTLTHLRNMQSVTEMGGIVMPPVPALYAHPKSIDEMVDHTVGRALDLFDLDVGLVRRWNGLTTP